MRPVVKYDARVDSLTIDAGDDIHIAVSSCVEDCLVGDFGSESRTDVVGIELLAARKLLAQFCAVNESEARKSRSAASAMAPLKADYNGVDDILTISAGPAAERLFKVSDGFVAHLGFSNKAYIDKYSVVGFELHDASERLAPWFRLNRAPLSAAGGDGD